MTHHFRTSKKRLTDGFFNFTEDGRFKAYYTDRKCISDICYVAKLIIVFAVNLPFNFTTISLTADHWLIASCFECEFFNDPPGSKLTIQRFIRLHNHSF